MATINICSNIKNGIGLELEYNLLRKFLKDRGHTVNGIQWTESIKGLPKADLMIWLEVVTPHLVPLAPEHWLIVNPEWLRNEWLTEVRKPYFTKILCKTKDALHICEELTGKAHYIGFMTRDNYDKTVARERRFLHVGGNGGHRNTQAVIDAWADYRYYDGNPDGNMKLTVVSRKFNDTIEDVTFIQRATDEQLVELQNSHLFHLYPSAYEGFGHALHEGLMVGAVVLTTDAPPMNEFECPFLVPSTNTSNYHQGIIHEVSPMDIRTGVKKMLALSDEEIQRMGKEARAFALRGNKEFETLFEKHLATIGKKQRVKFPTGKLGPKLKKRSDYISQESLVTTPVVSVSNAGYNTIQMDQHGRILTNPRKLKVAILGNHAVSYCTERELGWTLEHLGHHVIRFHEKLTDTNVMLQQCDEERPDLFLYIHTHGVTPPGDLPLNGLFDLLHQRGILTASFHLDRFWGLNALDKREDRIGKHPFWLTDFVFTADGGNQDKFHARGINHIWLPPGVVERRCHWGLPQDKFACDVAFVGAKNYHPEYPFRTELITFLEKSYGRAFKRFSGDSENGLVREQDLNDTYASAKVTVGDCCFAGEPFYWSDRVPESVGRGAFLIHPEVPGMRIPGIVTFKPGDLKDMKAKIDYYLVKEDERRGLREQSFHYARDYETYTNRVKEMLMIMGLH